MLRLADDTGSPYSKHFLGTSYKLLWKICQQNTDLKCQTQKKNNCGKTQSTPHVARESVFCYTSQVSCGTKDSNSAVDGVMPWLTREETHAWFTCWDLETHLGCRCTSHSASSACVSIQRTQDGTPYSLALCPHARGGARSPGGQVAENYSWKLPRRRITDLEPWRTEENLQG